MYYEVQSKNAILESEISSKLLTIAKKKKKSSKLLTLRRCRWTGSHFYLNARIIYLACCFIFKIASSYMNILYHYDL